jgi:phosphoserine phosphatase RsbU/P
MVGAVVSCGLFFRSAPRVPYLLNSEIVPGLRSRPFSPYCCGMPELGPSIEPRRKRIALLLNLVSSAYQISFRAAIEDAVHARGANFLLVVGREVEHVAPSERVFNRAYEWLNPKAVDGVVLLSGALANSCGTEGLVRLKERLSPLPVVSIGIALPGVPSVVLDNRAALRSAVEHLIVHHRLRRIAYLSGPSHNQEAVARFAGYREALEAHGIAYDPGLVGEGSFTVLSGQQAMENILAAGNRPEGVVAANDYMAIGAMDAMRQHGISVPEDTLVVGFDDAPVARFAARSLSSVAQPIAAMAQRIVGELFQLMEGAPTQAVSTLPVDLTLRESCGCGYVVRRAAEPSKPTRVTTVEYLEANRSRLISTLLEAAGASRQFWSTFVERLVDGLIQELRRGDGAFLLRVEQVAEAALTRDISLDDVARAIVVLRREWRAAGLHGAAHAELEDAAMKALAILAAASTRKEGRRALDLVDRAYGVRDVNQQISLALDQAALGRSLAVALPNMGVQRALLALLAPEEHQMHALVAVDTGLIRTDVGEPYSVLELMPRGFPREDKPWSMLVFPLTFETEVLGLLALDGATDAFACESLRSQISATLKLGALHLRVIEETALRERLAREQLLGEMAIAKRIQTALAPVEPRVSHLEIGAGMLPADQVGGDYYDIFSTHDGAWLGIGDVTGHGLLSGLIMLMVQSVVSTLVKQHPDGSPSDLVASLNDVLRPNIRERLRQSEHITLMLLRYFEDGRLVFAGAHEELIHYQANTGKCHGVNSEGMWIGILEDIRPLTRDAALQMAAGDIVVLFTDGIIEARDARGEQYGIERLYALIEANATLSCKALYQRIVDDCLSWAAVQQDDITCVVLRRTAA